MALKMKKKDSGGGANWMDTYGDMVTLLLCFFVLLYSMSTISEENWKALVMSFNPSAVLAIHETSGDEGPSADPTDGVGLEAGVTDAEQEEITQEDVEQQMQQLYESLQSFVEAEGLESSISVTQGEGKVFISFSDTVFFAGDSATLLQEAYPILDNVSRMLTDASEAIDEIRVLGHTAQGDPGRANNVRVDRTLSSNRAANVVIYVQENSTVDPARLISEGIGQWRPVASNDTAEGRAKNRRVEMIVSGRDVAAELGEGVVQYETGDVVRLETTA